MGQFMNLSSRKNIGPFKYIPQNESYQGQTDKGYADLALDMDSLAAYNLDTCFGSESLDLGVYNRCDDYDGFIINDIEQSRMDGLNDFVNNIDCSGISNHSNDDDEECRTVCYPKNGPLTNIGRYSAEHVGNMNTVGHAHGSELWQSEKCVQYFEAKLYFSTLTDNTDDGPIIGVGGSGPSRYKLAPGMYLGSAGLKVRSGALKINGKTRMLSSCQQSMFGKKGQTQMVVGCGVCFVTHIIFFTINGKVIVEEPFIPGKYKLFPAVCLQFPGERVDINYGQQEFRLNLKRFEMGEIRKACNNAKSVALSDASVSILVGMLLLVGAKKETYMAFKKTNLDFRHGTEILAESVDNCVLGIDHDIVPKIDVKSIVIDLENTLDIRATIRTYIISGEIHTASVAIKEFLLTQQKTIRDFPLVVIALLCQQCAEMVHDNCTVADIDFVAKSIASIEAFSLMPNEEEIYRHFAFLKHISPRLFTHPSSVAIMKIKAETCLLRYMVADVVGTSLANAICATFKPVAILRALQNLLKCTSQNSLPHYETRPLDGFLNVVNGI